MNVDLNALCRWSNVRHFRLQSMLVRYVYQHDKYGKHANDIIERRNLSFNVAAVSVEMMPFRNLCSVFVVFSCI